MSPISFMVNVWDTYVRIGEHTDISPLNQKQAIKTV